MAGSLTGVSNPPDRATGIFGDQQRAILVGRDTDRPAPNLRIIHHKTGGEIFVFARWRAVFHDHANDLVSSALGSIPRTVFGGKDAAAIVGRELACIIERQPKRRRMRL